MQRDDPRPETTDPQRGSARRQAFWTTAVVLTVALVAVLGTVAGFTATTTNGANAIAAGTVKIDQHAGSTSLYSANNAKPGEATTGCVRVTYSGSLPAMVRLYATAGITNGSAFNLKVERGSGLTSPSSSMSCTGFSPASTVYDATLSGFPSDFDGGGAGKRGGAAWASNDSVDYRFTITPKDDAAANGHTTAQATSAHDFTWQARNFGGPAGEVLSTPGLQSYWRLGETGGTTAYDSAPHGGVDATYNGGPTLGRGSLTPDAGDPAIGFDGADDHLTTADLYDFPGTAPFSIELWVNPTSVGDSTFRNLIDKRPSDANGLQGWVVYISPASGGVPGTFRFERWRDGATSLSSTGSTTRATAGQTAHVIATYDGSQSRVYVNGVLEGTSAASSTALLDRAGSVRVGQSPGGGARYAGDIDDISIYDRALTATEASAHYRAGR